ncbi:hypothetical protein CBR_g47996 [Chara braunii]|uniref:Uncharacterized protein n=1 Tax=Chara braunii TaxID=69332 RepID=A0A388M1V8_CHABU|nr:hypothetical protein CBR_g47996 [Chara braunii]|eukprot:GBG88526.1 hypothetical protein CBR_g47996 [Chara braunii]
MLRGVGSDSHSPKSTLSCRRHASRANAAVAAAGYGGSTSTSSSSFRSQVAGSPPPTHRLGMLHDMGQDGKVMSLTTGLGSGSGQAGGSSCRSGAASVSSNMLSAHGLHGAGMTTWTPRLLLLGAVVAVLVYTVAAFFGTKVHQHNSTLDQMIFKSNSPKQDIQSPVSRLEKGPRMRGSGFAGLRKVATGESDVEFWDEEEEEEEEKQARDAGKNLLAKGDNLRESEDEEDNHARPRLERGETEIAEAEKGQSKERQWRGGTMKGKYEQVTANDNAEAKGKDKGGLGLAAATATEVEDMENKEEVRGKQSNTGLLQTKKDNTAAAQGGSGITSSNGAQMEAAAVDKTLAVSSNKVDRPVKDVESNAVVTEGPRNDGKRETGTGGSDQADVKDDMEEEQEKPKASKAIGQNDDESDNLDEGIGVLMNGGVMVEDDDDVVDGNGNSERGAGEDGGRGEEGNEEDNEEEEEEETKIEINMAKETDVKKVPTGGKSKQEDEIDRKAGDNDQPGGLEDDDSAERESKKLKVAGSHDHSGGDDGGGSDGEGGTLDDSGTLDGSLVHASGGQGAEKKGSLGTMVHGNKGVEDAGWPLLHEESGNHDGQDEHNDDGDAEDDYHGDHHGDRGRNVHVKNDDDGNRETHRMQEEEWQLPATGPVRSKRQGMHLDNEQEVASPGDYVESSQSILRKNDMGVGQSSEAHEDRLGQRKEPQDHGQEKKAGSSLGAKEGSQSIIRTDDATMTFHDEDQREDAVVVAVEDEDMHTIQLNSKKDASENGSSLVVVKGAASHDLGSGGFESGIDHEESSDSKNGSDVGASVERDIANDRWKNGSKKEKGAEVVSKESGRGRGKESRKYDISDSLASRRNAREELTMGSGEVLIPSGDSQTYTDASNDLKISQINASNNISESVKEMRYETRNLAANVPAMESDPFPGTAADASHTDNLVLGKEAHGAVHAVKREASVGLPKQLGQHEQDAPHAHKTVGLKQHRPKSDPGSPENTSSISRPSFDVTVHSYEAPSSSSSSSDVGKGLPLPILFSNNSSVTGGNWQPHLTNRSDFENSAGSGRVPPLPGKAKRVRISANLPVNVTDRRLSGTGEELPARKGITTTSKSLSGVRETGRASGKENKSHDGDIIEDHAVNNILHLPIIGSSEDKRDDTNHQGERKGERPKYGGGIFGLNTNEMERGDGNFFRHFEEGEDVDHEEWEIGLAGGDGMPGWEKELRLKAAILSKWQHQPGQTLVNQNQALTESDKDLMFAVFSPPDPNATPHPASLHPRAKLEDMRLTTGRPFSPPFNRDITEYYLTLPRGVPHVILLLRPIVREAKVYVNGRPVEVTGGPVHAFQPINLPLGRLSMIEVKVWLFSTSA